MLAVNDDNGNFTGQIEQVEFLVGSGLDAQALSLDNAFWPPATTAFKRLGKARPDDPRETVKIGRLRFVIRGYATWVGNICWDAIRVSPATAAKIANYLRGMKVKEIQKWRPDSGWAELFEKYQQGKRLTREDFIERLEAKEKPCP